MPRGARGCLKAVPGPVELSAVRAVLFRSGACVVRAFSWGDRGGTCLGLLVEILSISQWDAVIPGRGVGADLAPLRYLKRPASPDGDGWLPRSPARGLAACPPCGTLRLSLPQRGFRARLGTPCAQTHLAVASRVRCDEPGWERRPPLSSAPGALDGGGELGRAPSLCRDLSPLRVAWVDAGMAQQLQPGPEREQRRSCL